MNFCFFRGEITEDLVRSCVTWLRQKNIRPPLKVHVNQVTARLGSIDPEFHHFIFHADTNQKKHQNSCRYKISGHTWYMILYPPILTDMYQPRKFFLIHLHVSTCIIYIIIYDVLGEALIRIQYCWYIIYHFFFTVDMYPVQLCPQINYLFLFFSLLLDTLFHHFFFVYQVL